MNEKIKISIITVVYNGKEYLEETIKSVINQDFRDFEYIIIDGGSTDETVDVVKKYEKYIDKWVSEKDKGIYDAMNKGVRMAQGEYLYFLNAGDYFCNKNILKEINQHLKYDLVAGRVILLYDNFNSISNMDFNFKFGKMPCHQAIFIRRKIFVEIGGFDIKYKSSADFDLLCKFSLKNYIYKILDIKISKYLSGGLSSDKNLTYKEKYQIIKKHFGKFYAYLFYLNKMIIEQGLKRILISLGLRRVYEKLLKVKMKGFDNN
jgi:glycosyltransferase involved in cell wall biosynthesis